MTTADIVTSINQRLVDAKAEIDRLEQARKALLSGDAPTPPQRPRRRTRRAARAADVVPAGKLTALLQDSAGMSTAALAKAANGEPDEVRALLRDLENSEQVRRTGQRRGTRWHLITDDDRIAARTAEIARQSSGTPKAS
jgi:uncharacterized small protein (DUF1192 family)